MFFPTAAPRYSVNLILRECKRDGNSKPGAFMYIPDSRTFLDAHPDFDLSILDGPSDAAGLKPMVVPDLKPGTLYLFAGKRSLHCVSQNTTEVCRVNAIFTFNLEPNVSLNEYTRRKFFGAWLGGVDRVDPKPTHAVLHRKVSRMVAWLHQSSSTSTTCRCWCQLGSSRTTVDAVLKKRVNHGQARESLLVHFAYLRPCIYIYLDI